MSPYFDHEYFTVSLRKFQLKDWHGLSDPTPKEKDRFAKNYHPSETFKTTIKPSYESYSSVVFDRAVHKHGWCLE